MESLPRHVRELLVDPGRGGMMEYGVQTAEDPLASDDPEHIEATQGIDRGYPLKRCPTNRWFYHSLSFRTPSTIHGRSHKP